MNILALTRKPGESVVIEVGGKIVQVWVDHFTHDRRVRLGFKADDDVRIDRYEIWEKRNTPAPAIYAPGVPARGPGVTERT